MPLCHHQSDPVTCPTCLHRAKKAGKPLLLAIHDAADQFSENHQALSGLMFNTLCAIVEDLVGPVFRESLADRNDAITQLNDEAARDQGIIVALQKFKTYVHKRLDDAGVPKFDDGRECRIGARLDWIVALMDAAKELQRAGTVAGPFDAALESAFNQLDQALGGGEWPRPLVGHVTFATTLPVEGKREVMPCYGCERAVGWLKATADQHEARCPICKKLHFRDDVAAGGDTHNGIKL